VTEAHEKGISVGAWNALVRRARIGRDYKAACFVVSSYANTNGTHIHCGVARIAVDLEIGYSTARRYLAWMRKVGLIELVRAGNRRKNLSDEYRLILGPDVMEHIEVLDPADHKRLTDELRDANRTRVKDYAEKVDLRSAEVSAEEADPDGDLRSPKGSAKEVDQRSFEGRSALALGERPPRLYTFPKGSTSPADDEDLRTDVAVDAPGPSVVVEIFPGASLEPPYVRPAGATRAQEVIADAIARRALARAAHAKEAT
jgi:hypothetical protein